MPRVKTSNGVNRERGEAPSKTDQLADELRSIYSRPPDPGRRLHGAEFEKRKRELEERDRGKTERVKPKRNFD